MSTADWTPGYTNRWQNDKIKALSPLAKEVFDYLTGSSKTTASGIYTLDLEIAGKETGIKPILLSLLIEELATVHKRLRGDRNPLIKFDGSVVWVVGQWKHAVSQSANHKNRVGNEFNRAPRLPYWLEFFALYPEVVTHCTDPKSRFKGSALFNRLLEALKKAPELTGSEPFRSPSPREGLELYEALRKCFPEALQKPFISPSNEALQGHTNGGLPLRVEKIVSNRGVGSTQPNPPPKSEKKPIDHSLLAPMGTDKNEPLGWDITGTPGPTIEARPGPCDPIVGKTLDPLDLPPGEAPSEIVHGPIGRSEWLPIEDGVTIENPIAINEAHWARVDNPLLKPPPEGVDPSNSTEIKKPSPKYVAHSELLARLDSVSCETSLDELRSLITGLVEARADGLINADDHRAFSEHVMKFMNEIEGGQS